MRNFITERIIKIKLSRLEIKILLFFGALFSLGAVVWLAYFVGGISYKCECGLDLTRIFKALGIILNASAILCFAWMVVVLSHRIMQKSSALIISFCFLFLYGVLIYNLVSLPEVYDSAVAKIFSPIISTLSIFFPSRGGYEEGFAQFSICYTILHFCSYVYLAILGMSLFGRKVMSRFLAFSTNRKFKNVFWGYSDGGILLAKDIMHKTNRTRAIFVLDKNSRLSHEQDKFIFSEIDEIGGAAIYCNLMKQTETLEASKHFFMTEDQDLNVKLAFMVLKALAERPDTNFRCELYVRTELTNIDRYFSKAKENLKAKVEINIVNESELTARRFIDKCKPIELHGIEITENLEVKFNFNVLQLGYGWTGRAILDKLICNTRFVGSTFSATVFDKDLKTKHGFYPILDKKCYGNKGDVNDYCITPKSDIEIGSEEFKEWVQNDFIKKKFNLVVVALGDDALNVEIALAIAKVLNNKGYSYEKTSQMIYAHVRNRDCYTYFELDETPISIFGNKNKIYTADIIVNDELDELAKELNYYYNFSREDYKAIKEVNAAYVNDKNEKWHSARIFDQVSSRAAAHAIAGTLRICGMKKVKMSEDGKPADFPLENMINLYINEHNRWNAFHFTQGIKCWDLANVTYETFKGGKPKPNRIKEENRHAALVFYEDLPKVDEKFNELIEQYNNWRGRPYIKYFALYNKKYAFDKNGKCTMNLSFADEINLQEIDEKFVRDIAIVLSRIDYKIIKFKTK